MHADPVAPIQQATFPALHAATCSLSSFACIVADPPWHVKAGPERSGPNGKGEGASRPLVYPTMSVAEIAALEIPAADDAHLYIWTINKYIEDTYDIARAWGFEPSTMLYWLKQPIGLGLGGAFVPCVEPILFCRRGKLPAKRRMDRNWWGWPRGRHSAKPEEFQSIVEQVSPGPYLEMFARRKRHGWAAWGNEITPDVEIISSENVKSVARRRLIVQSEANEGRYPPLPPLSCSLSSCAGWSWFAIHQSLLLRHLEGGSHVIWSESVAET